MCLNAASSKIPVFSEVLTVYSPLSVSAPLWHRQYRDWYRRSYPTAGRSFLLKYAASDSSDGLRCHPLPPRSDSVPYRLFPASQRSLHSAHCDGNLHRTVHSAQTHQHAQTAYVPDRALRRSPRQDLHWAAVLSRSCGHSVIPLRYVKASFCNDLLWVSETPVFYSSTGGMPYSVKSGLCRAGIQVLYHTVLPDNHVLLNVCWAQHTDLSSHIPSVQYLPVSTCCSSSLDKPATQ